jgi:hypothetical protein
MRNIRRGADEGTLDLILLVASLALLVVLRWLALKSGYASDQRLAPRFGQTEGREINTPAVAPSCVGGSQLPGCRY